MQFFNSGQGHHVANGWSVGGGADIAGKIVFSDPFIAAQDYGSFDGIAKLPNMSRPVVVRK